MAATAIAFDNVCKSFDRGRVRAVDHVSLAVAAGEFLCIVGGSGSGKTTLLRLANRLIEADSGTIAIDGASVAAGDPIALRRRIGYVFQSAGLFPHMSVAENVGITPRLTGAAGSAIAARVNELLALVRLDAAKYRDRFPHELSGGERQRVVLARALCQEPRVLVLDEPTAHLDLRHQADAVALLRQLRRGAGLTVLLVSHDLNLAAEVADRVLLLNDGRIERIGAPESVLDEPTLSRVYGCPVVVDKHPSTRRLTVHIVWPNA